MSTEQWESSSGQTFPLQDRTEIFTQIFPSGSGNDDLEWERVQNLPGGH